MFGVINTVSIHIWQSAKHGLLSIDYVVVLSAIITERHLRNECIEVAKPFVFSNQSIGECSFLSPCWFQRNSGRSLCESYTENCQLIH